MGSKVPLSEKISAAHMRRERLTGGRGVGLLSLPGLDSFESGRS